MTITELYELFIKSKGISTDTRNLKKGDLFIALSGKNFNGNKFAQEAIEKGASYAIIDDKNYINTNNKIIYVNNTLNVLQNLASHHRSILNTPIIALTGSNGKTTTKELIRTVLAKKYRVTATEGNLNNHIGVPLTLLNLKTNTEIGIIEMGANHQKEIKALCEIASPDFGYITNFGKAHLEGFGGIEGVVIGKSELYDYLRTHKKHVFINTKDNIQVEKSKNIAATSFSTDIDSTYRITHLNSNPNVSIEIENQKIKSNLIGDYNFSNICAAICIGKYFNISTELIKEAIESYIPKNNRSQIINSKYNTIILDAYNANPSSISAAISNLASQKSKHKMMILGDMFELGKDSFIEHQKIVALAESLNLNHIILVGEKFYNTKTTSKTTNKYRTFDDFKANYKIDVKNHLILIKGSRGMALERTLDFI